MQYSKLTTGAPVQLTQLHTLYYIVYSMLTSAVVSLQSYLPVAVAMVEKHWWLFGGLAAGTVVGTYSFYLAKMGCRRCVQIQGQTGR